MQNYFGIWKQYGALKKNERGKKSKRAQSNPATILILYRRIFHFSFCDPFISDSFMNSNAYEYVLYFSAGKDSETCSLNISTM